MRGALLLIALLAPSEGCGDDCSGANYLCGSLASSYGMRDFEEVRVRLASTEVAVEYVRPVHAGEEIPIKIAVNFLETPIVPGEAIDLLEHGTVDSVASSDLPEMESGTLTFDQFEAEEGATAAGRFQASFDNREGLIGHFSARVDDIRGE